MLTHSETRRSRKATCAVLDLVEQGALDRDILIRDLLNWMSESEVREFCERNLPEVRID